MISSIQLVLLIFIIFFFSRVFLRSREKVIGTSTAFFWFFICLIALTGILLPATTTKIATFFGVGRGVDVILYLAISVLFYLVFRLYVMIEDIRREITALVRSMALSSMTPAKSKSRRKRSSQK